MAETRRSRVPRFLGRPWWEGIGAIVGVLALVVGAFQLMDSDDDQTDGEDSAADQHIETGDVAVGSDNDCVLLASPDASCSEATPPAEELVSIRTELRDSDQPTWLAPLPEGSLPSLNDCDVNAMNERADTLREQGGLPHGQLVLSISVVNDSDQTMVIGRIDIDIVSEESVTSGSMFHLCEGGGGYDEQVLEVDLDESPPTFSFRDSETSPIDPITVVPRPGEPAIFAIVAHAEERQIRWTATLQYELDGDLHTATIDDEGQPFEFVPCLDTYLCTDWSSG